MVILILIKFLFPISIKCRGFLPHKVCFNVIGIIDRLLTTTYLSARPVSKWEFQLKNESTIWPFSLLERDTRVTRKFHFNSFSTNPILRLSPLSRLRLTAKMCGCEKGGQRFLYLFLFTFLTCEVKQWQLAGIEQGLLFFISKPTLENDNPNERRRRTI
jgi:hypothetical protein